MRCPKVPSAVSPRCELKDTSITTLSISKGGGKLGQRGGNPSNEKGTLSKCIQTSIQFHKQCVRCKCLAAILGKEQGEDAVSASAKEGGAAPPLLKMRLLRLHPLLARLHGLLPTTCILPMACETRCSFLCIFPKCHRHGKGFLHVGQVSSPPCMFFSVTRNLLEMRSRTSLYIWF